MSPGERGGPAPPGPAGPGSASPPTAETAPGRGPALPVQLEPSAVRLVGTLSVAGALAGLAIVLVYQWASPRIAEHQARVLAAAVTEVLGAPDRYETLFVEDGRLTAAPAGDTAALDRVWVGYDGSGRPMGVAATAAEPGFQDVIRLIFGYDPSSGDVLGMKVLESKETPGLGDKIEKDSAFVREFRGVGTPLVGVTAARAAGAGDEVVMITGATISSRAIVDMINRRLEALGGVLGGGLGALPAVGTDAADTLRTTRAPGPSPAAAPGGSR